MVAGEIIRDFHPGVAAAYNKDILAGESLAIVVGTGVHQLPRETVEPRHIRDGRFTILTGRNDQEAGKVDLESLPLGFRVPCLDAPPLGSLVVGGGDDRPVIVRLHIEVEHVVVKVVDEVNPGDELGQLRGERHVRKAAELLGQVKLQPVISPLLPERGTDSLLL